VHIQDVRSRREAQLLAGLPSLDSSGSGIWANTERTERAAPNVTADGMATRTDRHIGVLLLGAGQLARRPTKLAESRFRKKTSPWPVGVSGANPIRS
jgi:hypothetical protein